MKLALVTVVLAVLVLAAPLHAASPEQAEAGPVSLPSQIQLWRDPGKIEDLKDVLFEFDTHESASEHAVVEANAQWLKDHPDLHIRLAGYTDIRGDIVYNLALSQRRADTVKQELVRMGIAESRIEFAIGWGELYPNCLESTEECWAHQRRVEFLRAIQ